MIIDSPIISGSQLSSAPLFQNGSVQITGSLSVSGSISGANFSGSVVSSSYAVSSSNAESSSFSLTASISLSGTATSASITSLYQNLTAEISASTQIVSTTTKLYDLSAYKGVMMDYVVSTSGSGANMRAGTFTATWNATSSVSNESMTMDIGDTTAVQFSADKTGSIFVSASSGTWVIDSLYRSIGVGFPTGSTPPTPPTSSGTYAVGRNGQSFTLYSPADPLVTGSILYTDSGSTIPFSGSNFWTNNYYYTLDYPSGSVKYVYVNFAGNTMRIPVRQTADLSTFPNHTAFTYPVAYNSLSESYANNAPVYDQVGSYSSYLVTFTGWTTISDGIYIFDYDDTTGLLSNPTTSSVVNGYSAIKVAIGSDACTAGNNARQNKNLALFFSGSSFENGITVYGDSGLIYPQGAATTASDGFYTFIIDSSGVVSEKTPYTNNFYIENAVLYYGDTCLNDSGSISVYYSGIYGNAGFESNIPTYYTDLCFTTPYTESGVFLNNGFEVYSVTTGSLTYVGACPAITGSVGLSDISAADACASSSIAPITVYAYATNPFILADAAQYNTSLFYTSTGNPVTASYISDGTNSYQIVQNISGSGFNAAILPATPC